MTGNRLASVLFVAMALSLAGAPGALGRSREIVGGAPAATDAFPWAAHLSVSVGATTTGCSGAVIAANVVLTAAHCVTDLATMTEDPVAGMEVVTDSADWTSPAAHISAVDAIVVPAGFTKYTLADGDLFTDDDIALLALATPTPAPAIALPSGPSDASLDDPGSPAEMLGWGDTSASAPMPPTQLQAAGTRLEAATSCADSDLFADGAQFDPIDQLCVLDAPADDTALCQGDSGGPLISDAAGTQTEIGVAIYSQGCVSADPSFYTATATWAGWIAAHLAALAPPSARTGAARPGVRSADLSGQVTLRGSAASFAFAWGTSTRYGFRAAAGSSSGGANRVDVAATISGLSPHTTYHYRLVAVTAEGTVYGADHTFRTRPAPALISPSARWGASPGPPPPRPRRHRRWSSAPSPGRGPTARARRGRRS